MKKLNIIILICGFLFFSGCSIKKYYSPEIDIVVKDFETKEVIYNARFFNINYDKSLNIEGDKPLMSSDNNGSIFKKAIYDFVPIQKDNNVTYSQGKYQLSHPNYNSYLLYYNCNNRSQFCNPEIKNITNDPTKKNILFECEECNSMINTQKLRL